jgi:diaminohydroxyphosphoribosylaminopyrimidine deaminase / 5-amino-6-(5-phosphoribosylamino)uracil reductase
LDINIKYMEMALTLAKKGEGYTSPNPMVGAVVVKNGNIVGKGYHHFYGGPHAEVYALDDAGNMADGADIYVNLEPCSHYGKTPPCVLKIIQSGIKRVIIGMEDPNPLVSGRGIKMLQDEGIEVIVGVLEKKSRDLNEVFIKHMKSEFPFVKLKIAQTLDGFIATKNGDSKWITNEKSRLYGHKLRHGVDAILVGINTVLKDNPALTTRLPGNKGKDSIRIVLDTRLSISPEARIINQKSEAKTIIVTSNDIDTEKKEILMKKDNVEILSLDLNNKDLIPLKELLKILHKREISSILVEGGSYVNSSFLKEGLVDKIYTFIAPCVLGGNDGISSFSGSGVITMDSVIKLKNVVYKKLGDNILTIANIS